MRYSSPRGKFGKSFQNLDHGPHFHQHPHWVTALSHPLLPIFLTQGNFNLVVVILSLMDLGSNLLKDLIILSLEWWILMRQQFPRGKIRRKIPDLDHSPHLLQCPQWPRAGVSNIHSARRFIRPTGCPVAAHGGPKSFSKKSSHKYFLAFLKKSQKKGPHFWSGLLELGSVRIRRMTKSRALAKNPKNFSLAFTKSSYIYK